MNRRTAATAVLAAAALAAAGCQEQPAGRESAARSSPSPAAAGSCSASFLDSDSTGVTLKRGTVTGSATLVCDGGGATIVTAALFYRPGTSGPTTAVGSTNYDGSPTEIATSGKCRTGQWYIGVTVDGAPSRGPVLDITDCSTDID